VNPLALALIAGIVSAVNVAVTKRAIARHDPAAFGAVTHLQGGLLCLAALPLLGVGMPPSAAAFASLLAAAVVAALGNAWYLRALARSRLSDIDLYLRTSALWTALFGAVTLGERLAPLALLGAALVVAALLIVAQRPERFAWGGGQGLALAAAAAFGAGNVLDRVASAPYHPLAYAGLLLTLTGLFMLPLAPRHLATAPWFGPLAWGVGLTFAATQFAIVLAYAAGGEAGTVILIAQVRLVLLLAAGYFLWRERDRLGRTLAAALAMIIGVTLLALGAGGRTPGGG
jgi:drug/metabolite transporter (DMT)-like permease